MAISARSAVVFPTPSEPVTMFTGMGIVESRSVASEQSSSVVMLLMLSPKPCDVF